MLSTPFVDGVKTGYTIDAGNVLVSSGSREGVHLIAAVLGEPTEALRDSDSLALLEYGLSLYRERRVVGRREPLTSASVAGQELSLPIVAAKSVRLNVRKGQEVTLDLSAPAEVTGPIAASERLGRAIVRVDGDARARTALLAGRALGAASIGDRIDTAVPGPPPIAWALITAALALVAILLIRRRARAAPRS